MRVRSKKEYPALRVPEGDITPETISKIQAFIHGVTSVEKKGETRLIVFTRLGRYYVAAGDIIIKKPVKGDPYNIIVVEKDDIDQQYEII